MTAPDSVAAAAVDLARTAAEQEAGDPARVGPPAGVLEEGPRLVLHRFVCTDPAYRGWYWTVEVARAPRAKEATVNEVLLLPGEGALLAPSWVPWSDRLRPGDVGVGDLLPTAADDPRLALRLTDTAGWVDSDLWMELGLGRARVLSAEGREDAAERWLEGDGGPDAPLARQAPAACATCGFFVRLVGALGTAFGVCANALAPDDARVVAVDHGCGAHSEALVMPSAHPTGVPFEDDAVEITPVHAPGPESDAAELSEPYGHS